PGHPQRRLAEHSVKYRVTGASLAIPEGDDVAEVITGVINERRAWRSRGTLFQIGSITKVFTTTLVMKLVDQGRVDLDAPDQAALFDLTALAINRSGRIMWRTEMTAARATERTNAVRPSKAASSTRSPRPACSEPVSASGPIRARGVPVAGTRVDEAHVAD